MSKIDEKIKKLKKQIEEIIIEDISTSKKVENLWVFFLKHGTFISVLNTSIRFVTELTTPTKKSNK